MRDREKTATSFEEMPMADWERKFLEDGVQQRLERLSEGVAKLHELVDDLADRFDPVLKPETPMAAALVDVKAAPPGDSDISRKIADVTENVRHIQAKVARLRDRVDL